MTSYTRSPRQVTMHCPVHGCKWLRTYFADSRKHMRLKTRAGQGLDSHIRGKHRKATTLINGR